MTEGQHPGEAQEKIHRHGGKPRGDSGGAERGVAAERRHPIGCEHQGRPDTNKHGQLAGGVILDHVIMPSSPSKPRGRISKTTAINTYMIASLAAGKNTAVTPDATPISRPPSSVPVSL